MNLLLLGLDEFPGKEICRCVYSLPGLLSFKKKKKKGSVCVSCVCFQRWVIFATFSSNCKREL